MRKKIKILFFHNSLPEYRVAWFNNLSELADIDFVITNKYLAHKLYKSDGTCAKINFKYSFLNGNGIKDISKILKNGNYNLIQLPAIDSFHELFISHYLIKYAKTKNIKLAYFWEKWEAPINKQPLIRKIKNFLLSLPLKFLINKNVDIFFSPGRKNMEYIISRGMDRNKIRFIPNSTYVPKCSYINIKKKYNINNKKIILLYFARVIKQKGLFNLINAITLLKKDINNCIDLLVVGDGDDLQRCKTFAKSKNLKNIIFCGYVNPKNRYNYFAQSDIFIFPTMFYKGWVDVWGLAINEALQFGMPIISTKAAGSAYELIDNSINGYIIDPDNPKTLAKAISKIVTNNEFYINAKNCNKKKYKIFNTINMAKVYIDECSKIV